MLQLFTPEVKERIEKEGSFEKLVSALFSLAQDLIDSGEIEQDTSNQKDLKIENRETSKIEI